MIPKIMEFMELIHAKSKWALMEPNIHDIFFDNNASKCLFDVN